MVGVLPKGGVMLGVLPLGGVMVSVLPLGCVMVGVLPLGVVNRGFDPKDYAIDIFCFSAYHISLISKNNILLVWSKLTCQYRAMCSSMYCSISGLTLYIYNSTWCHNKQLLISSIHRKLYVKIAITPCQRNFTLV